MARRTVVFGFVGTMLDVGRGTDRWAKWRPTVSLGQQEDFRVDRLVLFYGREATRLVQQVVADLAAVSPETEVVPTLMELGDPWDLAEVYGALHDFARGYPFEPSREDYLVHITTGTHIIQICMFLLVESRHFPARLVQTAPRAHAPGSEASASGVVTLIDLDLARYDALAARFRAERADGLSLLKDGIVTRNAAFNRLVADLERVAAGTADPLLLTGPTGSGKTRLAGRIYLLKKARHALVGPLVEVNCATIRGDQAMATLFGHTRGAFTGAVAARGGLLREADGGLLFLDEVGELGLEEQAMLLRAIEEGTFLPVGADRPVSSRFHLVSGTNRDLVAAVRAGTFRDDLLARIDLWTFRLPGLAERPEDIEPNVAVELERASERYGVHVVFGREARARFLDFAQRAPWPANFRELSGAVRRMAALAEGGRITPSLVADEIARLERAWGDLAGGPEARASGGADLVALALGERAAELDPFERPQLEAVLAACRAARSLSEAGRELFAVSRRARTSTNDADRLRKYLARFGLAFGDAWRTAAV